MKVQTILAAALFSLTALPAFAQAPSGALVAKDSQPGKVTLVEAVRISATVEAIDKATRQVTLKGPDGKTMAVTVGPEVKNFDQIKVGDVVVARYLESLTLELKKGTAGIRERVESGEDGHGQAGRAAGRRRGARGAGHRRRHRSRREEADGQGARSEAHGRIWT